MVKFINLDCTFLQNENLTNAITRIQKEVEIAVRQGVKQLVLSDKDLSSETTYTNVVMCRSHKYFFDWKKIKRICLN